MSYTSKYLEELRKLRGVTDDYEAGDDYTREYLKVLNEIAPLPVQPTPLEQSTPKASQTKKKEEKVDLFKKGGLFKDGYDFGDIWRTAGLTFSDAALSILEGIGGMAEGVLDLGGHIVAGGADLVGADNFADDLRKVVNHNTVSEAAEWIRDIGGEGGIGEGSVLGRTTRGVGQGVGQIGGILLTGGLGSAAGLGAVGTTALTTGTMFASSTGAGVSEAYNDGASDAEAWAYGTIKGGVDAASELIFGGLGKGVKALGVSHGLSSADDILAKKLSSKISSKVAKTFVQAGVKAGGEGLEEVLAGLGTAAAKMIYKDGVSYQELLEDENLLEQFVVGALSSGLAQSGGVVNSVKTGTDFISGMTANEETVVNKEVEKRIAQEETNGNKLSNKEKNAIYESVVADMDKGYISTDTIEEALGGDTFKAYQDAIKSEEAIKQEYEKLANTPKGELTHIQEKRLAELEAQIEAEPKSKALKQQLSESAFNLAKDSRLVETYNEQTRRKQAFQADVNQYEGLEKESIQKIISKGQMQNTNRAHDVVDFAVKTAAGRGLTVTTATTEEILARETEIHGEEYVRENFYTKVTKDGKTEWKLTTIPNAFIDGKEITLNVNSPRLSRALIGHEIGHTFEGTKYYDSLAKLLNSYDASVKGKEAYAARKASIEGRYKGIDSADAQYELNADLLGEYIFSDEKFVKHLTQDKNVFQKVFDEIKYMLKMATAGSQQQRDLLRIKHTFEKAWRESQVESKAEKNTTGKGDVKYALSENAASDLHKALYDLGYREEVKLRDETPAIMLGHKGVRNLPMAENASHIRENVFTEKEARSLGLPINKRTHYHGLGEEFYLKIIDGLDNVKEAYRGTKNAKDPSRREDYFLLITEFKDKGGNTVNVPVYINDHAQYNRVMIDVNKISTAFGRENLREYLNRLVKNGDLVRIKNKSIQSGERDALIAPGYGKDASNDNVPQKEENVKYSLSADTEGNKLTKGQQEYFKDSKVVDADGNLKIMYHGSNAQFTSFDRGKAKGSGLYGKGFYFTDSDTHAKTYGNLYSVYLNIRNPLKYGETTVSRDQVRNYLKAVAENEDYSIENYGTYNVEEVLNTVMGKASNGDAFQIIQDINATAIGDMVEAAELFNSINGTNFDGIVVPTETVAFYPEQIKRVDNTNPTADTDIRFSLSENVEETNDLVALHNMESSELLKALNLGGMPMPSIAILKAQQSHESYGDVSLIFPKDAIDPEKSRDNKVYGGDAWTPTYPSIEYKVSEKAQKAIKEKIDSLVPYDVQRGLGRPALDYDNLSKDINRYSGELARAYSYNYAMQYAFLVENGNAEQLPMTEAELDGSGRFNNALIIDVVNKLGPAEVERLANTSISGNDAVISALMDIANENARSKYAGNSKLLEVLRKKPLYTEQNFGFAQADSIIRAANKYVLKGTEQTVDYAKAKEIIEKAVDKDAYKKWLDDLFEGVVEKEGIRNNADFYTPSGNRRSWEALHWENTLENVLKVMKAQDQTGQGFFGGASIFGVANKDYKSIKEIKADSDRLRTMPESEYDELKNDFSNRLVEIAESIKDPNERNRFIALDNAVEEIVDAVRTSKTKASILRNMQKWNKRVTESTVDDIVSLINDISNMPTGYFEAKPQRAVGFDEVAVFVIPRNADVKLKQELLSRGYSIAEYDPDVEGDRQRVVNGFEEYKFSLSPEGEEVAPSGNDVPMRDLALQEDIAPVREDIQPKAQTEEEMFPDDNEPLSEVDAAAMNYEALWSMTDEDAPPVMEEPYTEDIEPSYISDPLKDKTWEEVGKRNVKAYSFEHPEVRPFFKQAAEGMLTDLLSNTLKGQKIYSWNDGLLTVTGQERWTSDAIAKLRDNAKMSYKDIERGLRAIIAGNGAENNAASKRIELVISEELFNGYIDHTSGYKIPADEDYINLLDEMQNAEANAGSFDSLMEVADDIAPPIEEDIAPVKETVTEPEVTEESTVAEEAPEEDTRAIFTVQQRLEAKLENAEKALEELKKKQSEYNASLEGEIEAISQELNKKKNLNTKVAQDLMKRIIRKEEMRDNINADYEKRIADQQVKIAKLKEEVKTGESPTEQAAMRAELHENMIDNIKSAFAEKGFDFDKVLENAKDLSTFSTVDNTPQRVLEKSLGYKEGKVLADLTVNKVAENETKAIRWLNSITDRKNGLLAQLVKEYNIKPGSKESAAAQMYAEGFFVNDDNEIIEYKDRELAIDFPDAKVRKNIKGLARDPRIREFYDGALAAINESRARNAYPEIKPLKNYFLHFRAMDDTFSRLGIPFNPNDIKAKDLPTDLNGVTADLKPGQPYFASSMHRKGKRTSFDLLGGIEQYATGASRQIFHIDDIQTLRALRNYVADTFGQAKGLEDLDLMTEEEAEAKIEEVYGAHLSTFAKFLNEEANVIAGKTALTDRGLEGIIGRRGITFLDSLNKQVGANMIGFNISSSLTNLIAPVQAFAKSNKAAFVKAMAQTASNRLKSIKGQSDGFMETNPAAIRRKGADRFARTPWQKVSDAGYVFMSAVDGVSTEIIARAKYNELTKKGMDSEQAHIETDKWVSRLMGDRSLGQQPQLYNSKMLGMFTKFQLEVRNQLDAQFYDTIQEAKLSNEEIKNELERNAKTAAKVTKTFVELAVLQHLFGKAFEAVAGYNPAFDIISALIKAFGFDDDEDDDDTFTDNLWEGAQELLGDLPYTSTLTGGRIPISSALPVEQFITGKDSYGNEKSRWETLGEAAPYYLMPGGYGQFKKTSQGLGMFDDDLPIAGSYTDSGNLRFPVAPTLPNIAQAAVFGQYASKNARDYFDNEYAPLKEKQIQEFIDLDIPIRDYRDIREGLKGKDTLGEKVAYIATLDLPIDKKNILVNNAANREEPIDMSDYGEYDDWGEFDYAKKYPDKYAFLQDNGISVKQYNKFTDDEKEAWSWAYQNPEKFALSKSIASDVVKYRSYTQALSDITADKDENGKSISGSRKEKVISYINNLDADYGEKIILFKSEYPSDDTYNYEIVEYLGSREDITYDEMITILYELGFTVKDGRAYWD